MDRSLSKRKRGSVNGSQTDDVVVSIDSPPDSIEERRSSSPVKKDYCNFLLKIVVLPLWEIWYPFVVHAIASPYLCIWRCITRDIKLLVQSASVIPHLIICLIWTISLPITLCTRMIRKKLPPSPEFEKITRKRRLRSVLGEKVLVLPCLAVSLDAFFFYIPILDEKNKCLDRDNTLMITVLVLRSLSDLFFISRIATRIHRLINNDQSVKLETGTYWPLCIQLERRLKLVDSSLLDSFAILPVQQAAIIIAFFRMGSSGYSYKMGTVNIFLVLHLICRTRHIYSSYKRIIIGCSAKSVLNFLFYILAAHVLGAFWYLFSIQRETSCWHQVCQNTTGCITTFHCEDTTISPSVTILNKFCPVSDHNATVFDFGIFLDALQSGTTGSINFPTKLSYTFWWGLKNLSNFGTNLQTSTYLWEILFTILIGVIGILLFLLLIGNVQTYIQKWASDKATAEMDEKIVTTRDAIYSWISRHLSSDKNLKGKNLKRENLKREIIERIREGKILEKHYARDVDLKFFFSILDNEKTTCLKKRICKQALKKVLERRNMDKYLSVIIQHLVPVIYQKDDCVVKKRKPLHSMLFIIDGEIVSSEDSNAGGGDDDSNEGVESCMQLKFKKGDLFAEDILSLQCKLTPPPLSAEHYKCETKVETFALTYEKWRTILMSSDIQRQQNEELVVYSKTKPILLNKAFKKLTTTSCQTIQREMRQNLKNMAYSVIEDQELRESMIYKKEIDIRMWLSINGFSNNAKKKIMTNIKVNGIIERTMDEDVDVKYLLSHDRLPWDIQKFIRRQLGMKSLKKVPMLQKMKNSVLFIMCEMYLQPEIYEAQTRLVQARKEVELMFIIIEGKVELKGEARSRRWLEKGNFYGEPLLSWATPNNLFSGPVPTSAEDVICHTKVEVLAMKASQFRTFVAGFNSQWIAEDLAFPYDKIDQELNEKYMKLESKDVEQIEDEELRKKIKIMLKENEILDWVSSLGLSEDITTQIKRSIKISKVVEENIDADVNLEYVLSINLPPNIKQSLKEHICISSLQKVPILENVDDDLLNRICLNLEPVILPEYYYFINAGQELDKMIIVVKGVVTCTSTSNESATPPVTKRLEKNDLFGEEVLTLAFPEIYSPPVSDQDVICRTKVEALALTVNGLQNVLSYYKDRLSHSDDEPLDGGVAAADTSVSSSTTLEQRLDRILELQVSAGDQMTNQGRKIDEMVEFLAKFGYESKPPPAT